MIVFRNLAEFGAPIAQVIANLLPRVKGPVIRVGILGVLGAGASAAGFLLLVPLMNALSQKGGGLDIGPAHLETDGAATSGLLLGVVLLVMAGLYLRYRIEHAALEVMRLAAKEAAIIGLMRVRAFDKLDAQKATRAIMGRVSMSCGAVMRQFASGVTDMLQLVVFMIALLWLNPWLTLGLLLPGLMLLTLYTRSVDRVLDGVGGLSKEAARKHKSELNALSTLIETPDITEERLRERVDSLHLEGAQGLAVSTRLSVRREIQRGPMALEALFPLALIPIALFVLFADDWQQHAARIVVYILLLRSVIGLAQRIAGMVIGMGRFHPEICCHADLCSGRTPLRCQFMQSDDSEDQNVDVHPV